jgi:hypothetical protein
MSDHPKECEICGTQENLVTDGLCTRCATFLASGLEASFKCEQCGGREDLNLFESQSILCRSCREGVKGIAIDHLLRKVRPKS